MATDRDKPDMHTEIADIGGETDRTKFRQTRPEPAKIDSPAKPSSAEIRPRPHTSGSTPATSGRAQQPSPGYKTTHPIGSRKVTENVITYHEPIFQSLANTWFESQRNLTMGKRKLEEDHEKMESVSPDSKKRKVENARAGVSDPNVKIKKKCTIENIIERIRTEKTMSRGTGAASPGSSGEGCSQSDTCTHKLPTTAKLSDVITPKEAIDKLAKHSAYKMNSGTPVDLSGKTVKTEHGCAIIKKEKSETPKKKENGESPKKTASDKVSECFNPTKLEVKHEAMDLSSPVKFTKLAETSKGMGTDRRQDTEGRRPPGSSLPQKNVKVAQSSEEMSKVSKSNKVINEVPNVPKKAKKRQASKDKDSKKKLADKKVKVRKKKSDSDNEKKNESPPIVKSNKKTSKAKTVKELLQEKALERATDVNKSSDSDEANEKKKTKEKKEELDKKKKQKTKKPKPDKDKAKKTKPPVFHGRAKRVASLNASTFMNILYERSPKSPKSPKLINTKRSKSESDLAITPHKALPSSFSYTNVANANVASTNKPDHAVENTPESSNTQEETSTINIQPDLKSALKSPKKERFSPKGTTEPVKGMLSENKHVSPKRKISFSDEIHIDKEYMNEVFNDGGKVGRGASAKVGRSVKKTSAKPDKASEDKSSASKTSESSKSRGRTKKSCILPAKSPEELAERKKTANIARLLKAREILMAKRKKASTEEEDDVSSDSDSSSDKDETEKHSSDDTSSSDKTEEENTVIKSRAKRGELFRAARTHISVEAKTVFENTASSPKWCECCQTSYFPSQPHQGMKVWLLKQLVDKGSSRAPEPIQSSSHHFITAHASCEVRPYSSPTHVPMMETSPYVSPLVSHGHVTCSGCGCGHGGMLHTAQCQNYSLGGVGNILSCQHYSGTYTVPYPHSSYTRCACASCCPGTSYHHAPAGQPLLHQAPPPPPPPQQIPISTADATSILLHRQPALQLQMAPPPPHEAPPPHSMPIQLSHSDSTISSHSLPLHLSHTTPPTPTQAESGMPHLDQSCHCLPGEVTNVTQVGSNTQSDLEYIDVGKEEDLVTNKAPNRGSSTLQRKLGNQTTKNGSKLAETVNKLKNAKTEKLKQKLKESKEQLNKKLSVNKLLNIRNTSSLQSKDKTQTIVLEEVTSKKKVKLLEPKKRKVSASDSQVDKAIKKSLLDTKVASKKGKKEAMPPSYPSNSQPSSQMRKDVSSSESQLEKSSKKVLDKKVVGKKGKIVGVGVASVEEEMDVDVEEGGASEREESRAWHGWSWDGEGTIKKVTNIFDGKEVQRKCYNAIQHDDGEIIHVKDCILVCSGRKMRDIPFVAKVTNFWEDPASGEMMMTILWYYRPEHIEGGRKQEHEVNELFAAKHRDESLVACIEDKGYVLTFNEYCRYMGEVRRTKHQFPLRKKVVPEPEESLPSNRMPPVDVDPENVFLCRNVYDLKLKRVLKNPS